MYKLTIGLEIHVEMLTKTKMFSAASNDLNAQPNTCINEIDVGLPGAMPSVNKKAVELAIKLAKALNMEIDHVLKFDRKNYFYCDLPKGFQITQFFNPIGKKGFLKVNDQEIKIERIHLEEDTAKQINDGSNILLDYNRAGVPLIEIVTNPDIHSKEECINFLKQLKQLLVFLNISSGKMETGNLRVDLNLSISDSTQLGERVEIKNLNSFNSIANAIDYEYKRQLNLINDKKQIKLETRRWDDDKQETIFMRYKTPSDYRYMVEPNIAPINILKLINEVTLEPFELPSHIKNELIKQGINEGIVEQLLDDLPLYKGFKYVSEQTNNQKAAINWIVVELKKLVNENNDDINNVKINVLDEIIKMIGLIDQQKINGKQAKIVIEQIYKTNKPVEDIIKQFNLVQVTDESLIEKIISDIIKNNPDVVSQYSERPERVEKFIIGLLMKETKGQANPIISKEILNKLLSK